VNTQIHNSIIAIFSLALLFTPRREAGFADVLQVFRRDSSEASYSILPVLGSTIGQLPRRHHPHQRESIFDALLHLAPWRPWWVVARPFCRSRYSPCWQSTARGTYHGLHPSLLPPTVGTSLVWVRLRTWCPTPLISKKTASFHVIYGGTTHMAFSLPAQQGRPAYRASFLPPCLGLASQRVCQEGTGVPTYSMQFTNLDAEIRPCIGDLHADEHLL
jgi:hypothetical protein